MRRAKQWLCRAGLAAMLAATAISGCSKSTEEVASQALGDPALRALLEKIPADTPYAFVMFGGSVRPLMERMYKGMAPLTDMMGKQFDNLPVTGENGPLVRAVLAELKGVMAEGGIEKLGIDIEGKSAIYGIGFMPAVRWALKDPAALRDMLGRVQQNGGVTFPTCKLGDVEYWCGGDSKVKVAAAILGNEFVFGVAPPAQADRVFGLLLGTAKPERSLADTPKLKDVMTTWGLGRFSVGFVDAKVIAEAFLGEGDPLNKDVLAAVAPRVAERWPQITAVCKDEIRGLVGIAPKVVFGTESLGADGFEGLMAVELRSDVAQDLRGLRAPVPGLSKQLREDALFALGAGGDVGKGIELAMRKAQEVTKAPYQCPELVGLNRAAEDVVKGASEQLPAFIPQLKGFNFVVQDVKMSGLLPSDIRGFLVVAAGDPKGLYEAMKAQVPEAGRFEMNDDGKVFNVPDGTVPFVNGIAYAAKAGKGVVVAVGSGSDSTIGKLLSVADEKDPPLMVIAYNFGKIMQDLAPLLQSTGAPEVTAVLEFYKMFGAAGYEVYAADGGVVVKAGMRFQ